MLKIIIETSQLTNTQIIAACVVGEAAGVDFMKTSTGFKGHGATIEHVQLMRAALGDNVCVKASGGVRDPTAAINMLRAGACKIGTSSGIAIQAFDGTNTQPEPLEYTSEQERQTHHENDAAAKLAPDNERGY